MQHVNLKAPPLTGRRLRAGHLLLVLFMALLIAGAVTAWQYQQASLYQDRLAEAEQRVTTAQAAVDAFRREFPDVADNSALEAEIEELQLLRNTRRQLLSNLEANAGLRNFSYYGFLESLANERIDGVWLTEFALSTPEQQNRLLVSLNGQTERTELLPRYLDGLRDSGLGGLSFNDLRLNRLQTETEGGLYQFSLQTEAREPESGRQGAETPQRSGTLPGGLGLGSMLLQGIQQ